ncbi:Mismatch repair protein msh3 [Elasticomyces elasticus]|nr:Mismatch repair protein msh3 [Elasticomyces elasticus]KAK3661802.1 Mismatch repair protein msh3 [Elasticomyces elasticus]KAK4924406.1 Mismatch repair protein msh3 [Elasticomyces elasticus]KAK5762629.1 Mismatch repair protein msh3 [Elasticomyces elasticus]
MGSQKPPAPSQQSSQKKQQQSISSFFGAPKPPKRPLDDVEQPQPQAKRAKQDLDDATTETERRNSAHSLESASPSRRLTRVAVAEITWTAPKTTRARTSAYLFSSSAPIPTSAAGEDNLGFQDDDHTREVKKRLHQKFVKKLGRPDSIADIKRRNRLITEETEDLDGAEEDEDDASPEPTSKSISKKGTAAKKTKLTPLEKQVLDIKHKHPDTLLVVEVGYKFRFFGEDARIAAKELSIVCIPGKFRFDEHPTEAHIDRFASASVPVHRLNVHVKRLVSAGHKVGVVRQLETAALKAAGTNRNTTFERGLTNLYTKGTYIDDAEPLDPTTEDRGAAPATGHLLCLTETRPKGWGSDEKVQIGLVAVQPSTGDIIYDDFEDGWMRSELETRLLHIAPCEFLIVGEVSKATEKLVQHLSGSKTNVFGDKARLERVDKPKTMAAESYSHITTFYATKTRGDGPAGSQVEASQETGTLLDKIHKLSENATICLSAMITHLTEYGLQHVFDLTKYFQSFSARSHMLLNGNTLTSLEIYRNQTDNSERGSLFWTLDRTVTRFGQRMLRKWVGRPLLDKLRLDERVAAVEELKDGGGDVDRIKSLLRKTRSDLERSLIRIYYKKCTRPELLGVLQTLQGIAQEYAHVSSPADAGFTSALLSEAIAALPKIGDDVLQYLERINAEAAQKDDKFGFFRDEHETEEITDHKMGIVAVEHDLQEFRAVAAEKLKRKKVDYVTVAGIDFLIELENSQLKNVPASWAKISGTKKMSRYHAPEVVKMLRERDQHKEALSNACDEAFAGLLGAIGEKYQGFRDCVQSLAVLDCLLSLAEVAGQPGYCKPEFREEIGVEIEGGRHPMVEQLLMESFVPNDVLLSGEVGGTRALLVTGPNMGGKSSYVRAVALCVIMAQIGSYVPADRARLGLLDAVFTRMGANDNMMKGESTFMVELGETSDILKQAGRRSLVILDELGRGTSTHDGVAIAQAVLRHAVEELKCLTLFITHYQSLARIAEQFPGGELKNVHMKFTEQANGQGEPDVTFLYEVGEGVAHRSYGLNVAKLAGLPKSLLDEAGRRSSQMEGVEATRRLTYLAKATSELLLPGGHVEEMEKLVAAIDQL